MFTIQITPTIITLSDNQNHQAEIYPYGGLLNRFAIRQKNGTWHNAIAGFSSPQHAKTQLTERFASAKLSPFVCRLAHGQYTYAAQTHQIIKHQIGVHAIHGLIYDALYQIIASEANEHQARVQLRHQYRGQDEQGYPFDYQITLTYTLHPQGKLSIATEIHNNGNQTLPIADGWHPYFVLDGALDTWTLHIRAKQQLQFSTELLPTGHTQPNNLFQTPQPLRNQELDNCFILNEQNALAAATLQSSHLRLSIHPSQSYPYLQAYIPPERDAIALENLSAAPDAFNNHIGLIQLPSGEKHQFETAYILQPLAPEMAE